MSSWYDFIFLNECQITLVAGINTMWHAKVPVDRHYCRANLPNIFIIKVHVFRNNIMPFHIDGWTKIVETLHATHFNALSQPKIDGLVHDCSISIPNALEILQSRTKPEKCISIQISGKLVLSPTVSKYVFVRVMAWYRIAYRLLPETVMTQFTYAYTWWRHQMETFSALLAICAGNSPVTGEVPAQRPVTRSFDVFFDLRLNKPLNKQSWGWWFEAPSRPLWRHCNV